MPTSYTSLLGLALPATGELQGTWGTTVNDAITSLLDTAVAGTTTLNTDADVTLSTTTGAANQARQAIILWTANGTVTRNITAPAQSKAYVVVNDSAGTQSIVIRGVGPTTGVTIVKGEKALVVWNGSDFVKVSTNGGAGTFTNVNVTGTTTLSGLTASTGLALDGSNNVVSVTNTGTGDNVLSTNATLVTPNLGTPSAVTLTNGTGLPISTGVSGLGTNVATFLGTPTSANLAAAVTDETGTGLLVFNTNASLVTPNLGTPSALTLTNATGLPISTGVSGLGANVAAALGNTTNGIGGFLTTDGTATVTNKRITERVSSTASISSPLAWNSDNFDQYAATAQAGPLTINADAGTPTDGQKIIFRFKDDGTPRALTWTTGVSNSFQAVGITLPTTTTAGKVTYVGAIYNANASRWDAVATVTQA